MYTVPPRFCFLISLPLCTVVDAFVFVAYHLYTVVPRLVKFIDYLTNVYVRMNRKRLRVSKAIRPASQILAEKLKFNTDSIRTSDSIYGFVEDTFHIYYAVFLFIFKYSTGCFCTCKVLFFLFLFLRWGWGWLILFGINCFIHHSRLSITCKSEYGVPLPPRDKHYMLN